MGGQPVGSRFSLTVCYCSSGWFTFKSVPHESYDSRLLSQEESLAKPSDAQALCSSGELTPARGPWTRIAACPRSCATL